MNVVLISPHFPPNHVNYARALRKFGDNALGIGDSPHISHELREALTEYVYVPNMQDYDAMLRTMGYFTSKYGKIDRVDSQNEFWLGLEARLREDFNIYGQKPAATDINRSKLGMKECCIKAKIPVAPGEEFESVEQLVAFGKKVGYPLVVKPIVGVGASATYAINNEEQAKEVMSYISGRYIAEKYIKGDVITFDGLIDRHGEIIFYTSHEYNCGVMETVNEARSIYYYSRTKIDPELKKLSQRVLKAFDVRERFFHIEWFRTAPSKYVFLEINVRPPGLYTIDMMNYSADINLYEAWVAALHDTRVFDSFEHKYSVGFAGRRVNVKHIHSHEDIMQKCSKYTVMSQPVPGSYADAMGEFFYLVRHPEEEKVLEMLEYILA
ncbi:MAG: ATP-grasp domain-containing protein [Bradymonadia bacterium]|jgi:hypothetical protein